ncbi:hypothetical protein KDH_66070 [Dictyobacter sp. S3.2.2.5]|uniref:Uncharacterized protein n=1 Tax=Dictyobacter halimunensis TaxID=3026934 RepID=A0ABQ6G4R4_9CHLR|nr:hypothetical protein KDH_66070 [Dictyobacter sp. S3.2.2.5]
MLYSLAQPYVIHFMDMLYTTAHPLINYSAFNFFTLMFFAREDFHMKSMIRSNFSCNSIGVWISICIKPGSSLIGELFAIG